MKIFVFVICMAFTFPVFAQTESRGALIYEIGQSGKNVKFTQKTEVKADASGKKIWSSEILDEQGQTAMTEKAEIKDGQITYQYIEQRQISEAYELKTDGSKLIFLTYRLNDGKKGELISTKTRNKEEPFITGPVVDVFLQKNWDDLTSGKTISANFGVFEFSDIVGFHFKQTASNEETIEVQMKASNIFVAMLTDPLYLTFSKSSKKLLHFKGRTPLQTRFKNKWTAFDADIVYLNGP